MHPPISKKRLLMYVIARYEKGSHSRHISVRRSATPITEAAAELLRTHNSHSADGSNLERQTANDRLQLVSSNGLGRHTYSH